MGLPCAGGPFRKTDHCQAGTVPEYPIFLIPRQLSQSLLGVSPVLPAGLANHAIGKGHRDNATAWLNDLCGYCGALAVAELKKGHIKTWLESHPLNHLTIDQVDLIFR